MENLSKKEKKLIQKEKYWEKEKELIKREKKLKEEKKIIKSSHKKVSTTKLLIAFLFLNCSIIEAFTGWATIKSFSLAESFGYNVDFSPLIALIGAVVGEVIGYAIYSIKSTKENTRGGIVYDSIFKTIEESNCEDNNAVG